CLRNCRRRSRTPTPSLLWSSTSRTRRTSTSWSTPCASSARPGARAPPRGSASSTCSATKAGASAPRRPRRWGSKWRISSAPGPKATAPAARVRIAGARAVVAALDGLRPDSAEDREEVGSAAVTVFGIRWGSSPATRKRLAAAWLEKFRAGEGRPEWFNQLIEPLRACMAGTDPAERVWAAAALVAVGQDDAALPVMREAARQHPEVRVAAASSLPWLPPDKRLALFDELLATGVGQGELGQLVSYLAKLPEPRVTDRLWQLVAAPGADVETADDVLDGLRTAYFAGQHYNASQLPAAKLAKIAEAAKPKALKGPELQRVVALVLLANSSDEEAAAAAAVVRADPSASPAL